MLRNRWGILAVLFAVRATIAFQFQSVAAVAPLLGSEFGATLADIGVLIGLYFAPGVALALPGGAIGQRFGDKTTVLGGLLLMLAGSLMMASATSWNIQNAGRLVAGAGGVKRLFNRRHTRPRFSNHGCPWIQKPSEKATVMLGAVHLAVAGSIGCGIVLLATLYRPPADSTGTSVTTTLRLDRNAAIAVIAAGLIWGMFNVGFAMIVSFGPSMLVDRCGRIDDQHRVVGLGRVRSLGRFSG